MWLRIGDKDFPKSSIKEIYRMGKTIQSGKWCIGYRVYNQWRYVHYDTEEDYNKVIEKLTKILEIAEV